jgi:Uri superfamily endonuclease
MDKGLYCLILSTRGTRTRVGRLGVFDFPRGYYVYIGSALGSGGLARLERHLRSASGSLKRPHWHIDYLLCNPLFRLEESWWAVTPERLECRLAKSLPGRHIPRFGSSDCRCGSHLVWFTHNPSEEIETAFRSLNLHPDSKNIITGQDQS